jgi:hypothetical protein
MKLYVWHFYSIVKLLLSAFSSLQMQEEDTFALHVYLQQFAVFALIDSSSFSPFIPSPLPQSRLQY